MSAFSVIFSLVESLADSNHEYMEDGNRASATGRNPMNAPKAAPADPLAQIRKIVISTDLLGGDQANAFRLIQEIIRAADEAAKTAA